MNFNEMDDRFAKPEKLEIPRFSKRTLLRNNWNDERLLEWDKVVANDFNRRYCLTFIQRKSHVIKHLMTPVNIAKYTKYLLYDIAIQITTNMKSEDPEWDPEEPVPQMVLSTNINEKQISDEKIYHMDNGCLVTVSKNTERLRRNVWRFCCSTSEDKSYHIIRYGDIVFIRIQDSGCEKELYLKCDMPTVADFDFGGRKNRLFITLSDTPDRYCMFQFRAIHLEPMYTDTTPIPSNSPAYLVHCASNRLLAFEEDTYLKNLFLQEQLASCYTYKNLYGQILPINQWVFITQTPTEEIET